MATKSPWVWRNAAWPAFSYDAPAMAGALSEAYRAHGVIEGKAAAIGLSPTSELSLEAMITEVVATAAIEGERLQMDAVRSSVMRRLGLVASGPADRSVDGLVAVIADATSTLDVPLTADQLCRWQSALFPGGTSGIQRIAVGRYRDHEDPMQIVSGYPGREVVHYEAPPSRDVPGHMDQFIMWFNASAPGSPTAVEGQPKLDGLARAAIAHLWFETIHPFEDGNGRIGRAIVDRAVAQHLKAPIRLYSLSRQLQASRKAYYDALNAGQRGSLDATNWVLWFVGQCTAAYAAANRVIDQALEKQRFWERKAGSADINDRQRKVLQRLLDAGDGGFEGGLNVEKYMKITGAPKTTATRDLSALVSGGQLRTQGAGKALRYFIDVPGWKHGLPDIAGNGHQARQPEQPDCI